MEKYQRITKAEDKIPDNEIRVRSKSILGRYLKKAIDLVDGKVEGFDSVVIKGAKLGMEKATKLAELVKHRVQGVYQLNTLSNITIIDEYKPLEEGLDYLKKERKLAMLTIVLTKNAPLDYKKIGYSVPISESEFKALNQRALAEKASERGRGREMRGGMRGGMRGEMRGGMRGGRGEMRGGRGEMRGGMRGEYRGGRGGRGGRSGDRPPRRTFDDSGDEEVKKVDREGIQYRGRGGFRGTRGGFQGGVTDREKSNDGERIDYSGYRGRGGFRGGERGTLRGGFRGERGGFSMFRTTFTQIQIEEINKTE